MITLEAYAADCRLFGSVDLGESRLTDFLNASPELRIQDARLESLADGHVVETPELAVARDELCAVVAAGPRGDAARRVRTYATRFVVDLGPYEIVGIVHSTSAADPLGAVLRRAAWVPLTDAIITYRRGPDSVRENVDILLVNRNLTSLFRAAEDRYIGHVRDDTGAPEIRGLLHATANVDEEASALSQPRARDQGWQPRLVVDLGPRPAPELPAAELPAPELPAAELPAPELPAAEPIAAGPSDELPAPEIPAPELAVAEIPAAEPIATGPAPEPSAAEPPTADRRAVGPIPVGPIPVGPPDAVLPAERPARPVALEPPAGPIAAGPTPEPSDAGRSTAGQPTAAGPAVGPIPVGPPAARRATPARPTPMRTKPAPTTPTTPTSTTPTRTTPARTKAARPTPTRTKPAPATSTTPTRTAAQRPTLMRTKPKRGKPTRTGRKAVLTAPVPAAFCPYCALLLEPPPVSSRRCARCHQRIIVKRVDGRAVYLTEAAVLVFETERRRITEAGRLARERERWIRLATAAGAPAERISRLSTVPLTGKVVETARALYVGTVDRAFKTAKRDRDWETASRLRRDEAFALYRLAGSPLPPPGDLVAMFREAVAAELRGIAGLSRDAELVSASCCDVCRADDGRIFRIANQLRAPRLPHEGCPKGLCRCGWDLAARDRTTMRRYMRRRAGTESRAAPDEPAPTA